MAIRQATNSDIEPLAILNREVQAIHVKIAPEVFRNPSEAEVSKWLAEQIHAENTHVFVAENDTAIHAYLILKFITRPQNPFMHAHQFAYIDHVAVSSSKRMGGIGRQIILHAIEFAANAGYQRVELDVWSKNIAAKSAFSRLSFNSKTERLCYESRLQPHTVTHNS
jgi:ribosomal protein S18 acetylase RimI-like enzyme